MGKHCNAFDLTGIDVTRQLNMVPLFMVTIIIMVANSRAPGTYKRCSVSCFGSSNVIPLRVGSLIISVIRMRMEWGVF